MATSAGKDRPRRRRKYDSLTSRRIPPQVDPMADQYRSKNVVKVDFSGVSSGFEPLTDGPFPVTITGSEIKDSKSTAGAQYVSTELTITDEADDASAVGRKVWVNWSLQPKALWRFKQDAVAFGIDPTDLSGEVDIEKVLDDLKGRTAIAILKTESYTANDGSSKTRNAVAEIKEATVGARR